MPEQSAVHHTFAIERSFAVTPDRVFSAFSDPARKRLWFAGGGGHDVEAFEMDFRVGGKELVRMRSKDGPMQGALFTNTGTCLDIVPDRRVVVASSMAMGDRRISVSLATFEFLPTETGRTWCSRIRVCFSGAPTALSGGRVAGRSCSNDCLCIFKGAHV